MLIDNVNQKKAIIDLSAIPVAAEPSLHGEVAELAARLNPSNSWGDRRIAALKLGFLGDQKVVPALLEALPDDNFWMVRCAIIQALELIGDPAAIPALREVSQKDNFKVVRSYAAKAIERLQ